MAEVLQLHNSQETMEQLAWKEGWEVDDEVVAELQTSDMSKLADGMELIRDGMQMIADATGLDVSDIILEGGETYGKRKDRRKVSKH